MDHISYALNDTSNDSDSVLQIDETISLKNEIIEDDKRITANQDELILPKVCDESIFDVDFEVNGDLAPTNLAKSCDQSTEHVDDDRVFELHIVDDCDIIPNEQSYITNQTHRDVPKLHYLRKIASKTKKGNQILERSSTKHARKESSSNKNVRKESSSNKNVKKKSDSNGSTRRLRSSMKNTKSPPPPPLALVDDDYVDSEDISLDRVPRFHRSVDHPKLNQLSSTLVTNAARQIEQLFHGNRLCFLCGTLANDAKDLGLHMMKIHSQITKGKWCHVCNQLVSGLFEHLQSHKNDVLKCPLCTSSSANFVDLRSHVLDHALSHLKPGVRLMPKWFLCNICPDAFLEELELNRHKSLCI